MKNKEFQNNIIASLYFGKTCTHFTLIEKTNESFQLHYLNSFSEPINLNNLSSKQTKNTVAEISSKIKEYEKFKEYQKNISSCFATIDTEYAIITKIPCDYGSTNSEFIELINLEIRQHFSNLSIDDFRVKITKLNEEPFMNLVVIIKKEIINSVEKVVSDLGFELTDINVSPLSAMNAFNYNYPDKLDQLSIIVHIKEKVLEFGIIENNRIIDYECYSLLEGVNISQSMEIKLNDIIKELNISEIGGIYFFGQNLTKQQYIKCWEVGMLVASESKRLNPFRMFNNKFEQRDKEYCSRMFHIYSPCIGGALPIQIPLIVN